MKDDPKRPRPGRPSLPDVEKRKAVWYKPHDEPRKGRRLYWTPRRIERFGDMMVKWYENNPTAVNFGAFTWAHKVPRDYINTFAAKSKYFDYCVDTVRGLLETRVLNAGLTGEIDKVMCIFTLKNVAGWRDKKEVNNNIEISSKVVELQLPKKDKPIEVKAEIVEAKKLGKPKATKSKAAARKSDPETPAG